MLPRQSQDLLLVGRQPARAERDDDIPVVVRLLHPPPGLVAVDIVALQEDLLGDPARQHPQVGARVAAGEVVAAAHLEVRLLDQRRPQEVPVLAVHDVQRAVVGRRREPVVDGHLPEAPVEVHPEDVLAARRDLGLPRLEVDGGH